MKNSMFVIWNLVLGLCLVVLPANKVKAAMEWEVDPVAFALDGYSFHLALSGAQNRVDVGVFALALPEDANNPDYEVYFEGSGVKWDYFGRAITGAFWGLDYSANEITYTFTGPLLPGEPDTAARRLTTGGFRVGYRIGGEGLYLTPWVGVSRGWLSKPVRLGGVDYRFNPWLVFPTVHLGYRF